MPKKNTGTFKKDPKGNSGLLYVPADLVKDSAWPLKHNDTVIFRVEGNSVVVIPAPGQVETVTA